MIGPFLPPTIVTYFSLTYISLFIDYRSSKLNHYCCLQRPFLPRNCDHHRRNQPLQGFKNRWFGGRWNGGSEWNSEIQNEAWWKREDLVFFSGWIFFQHQQRGSQKHISLRISCYSYVMRIHSVEVKEPMNKGELLFMSFRMYPLQ
ncbi:unnamed protein product [Lactuca virosa]|uniref:Uncharacterized protein n=1 Tax=Lactuca virosa TaxID=75947 RepID=A0AAU9NET2_9ASTR|nr:unnamed protein product [Lactuca virosa]